MLAPAETFELQRKLLWVVPGMLVMAWGFALLGWGLRGAELWPVLAALGVLGWLVGAAGLWLSCFGVVTTWVASLVTLFGFAIPFAVMLIPAVVPGQQNDRLAMLVVALAHGVIVALCTVWHARRRQPPAQPGGTVTWFMCRVHLATRRIEGIRAGHHRPADAAGKASNRSLWWGGAASVASYPVLKMLFPESALLMFAVLFGNALALWLEVGVLSQWMAQAWRLACWQTPDAPVFVSDRLAWLEKERQQHWWGRWLRQRFALPRGVAA